MVKVTNISDNGLKLLVHFECGGHPEKFLKAYQDGGGTWTIGVGTTRYPDGEKVKEGDAITLDEVYECFRHDLKYSCLEVDALTVDTIEQHQFDALVDFVYHYGMPSYKTSTLRKVINKNPKDYKAIAAQFLRWKYDEGKPVEGLLRRSKADAYLYVYGELKFYFTNNDNII